MQCFLKDADAKQQQGDERVRNWVADIRNVAYDAEDVIDVFILQMYPAPNSGKFRKLKYRHRVGRKIQDIRCTLKEISDSRATYGITNLGDNEASSSEANQKIQQQLRNHYLHVEDDDVIGLEE
ncbi:hypothetical protein MKX03_026754 [Papaver bracteatum]|nr:hypothetical protein MKX03_026754 [Papaver bracteatum]